MERKSRIKRLRQKEKVCHDELLLKEYLEKLVHLSKKHLPLDAILGKQTKEQDLFETLKKLGMKFEFIINEKIKEHMRSEDFLENANETTEFYSDLIGKLQEYVEVISMHLNIPTKRDVTNTNKLIIQTEEKIDGMEVQLTELIETVEELKQLVESNHIVQENKEQPPAQQQPIIKLNSVYKQ